MISGGGNVKGWVGCIPVQMDRAKLRRDFVAACGRGLTGRIAERTGIGALQGWSSPWQRLDKGLICVMGRKRSAGTFLRLEGFQDDDPAGHGVDDSYHGSGPQV